jgi:ribosomal protein L24E
LGHESKIDAGHRKENAPQTDKDGESFHFRLQTKYINLAPKKARKSPTMTDNPDAVSWTVMPQWMQGSAKKMNIKPIKMESAFIG